MQSSVLRVRAYGWSVGGFNHEGETGILKRTELKRIFKEARNVLKHGKASVVLIGLTGIDVHSYSELTFRLAELDLQIEVQEKGFRYAWAQSPTDSNGGVALFWKSVASPQIMVSECPMASAPSGSEWVFAEISVLSRSKSRETRILVGALSFQRSDWQKCLAEELVDQRGDYIAIIGSMKQGRKAEETRQSIRALNSLLKGRTKLGHCNRGHWATDGESGAMLDFIASDGTQKELEIARIESYPVCEKGTNNATLLFREKRYAGRYPVESKLKFPLPFVLPPPTPNLTASQRLAGMKRKCDALQERVRLEEEKRKKQEQKVAELERRLKEKEESSKEWYCDEAVSLALEASYRRRADLAANVSELSRCEEYMQKLVTPSFMLNSLETPKREQQQQEEIEQLEARVNELLAQNMLLTTELEQAQFQLDKVSCITKETAETPSTIDGRKRNYFSRFLTQPPLSP